MPLRTPLRSLLCTVWLLLGAGCGAAAHSVGGAPPVYLPIVLATPTARWQPPQRTTWQWQLSGRLDLTVDAAVYDVDLFDTPTTAVRRLHQQGRRVICYLSAGSWEEWRPDAAGFPPELLGKAYGGWPGERWLDIRRLDLLGPILGARLDLCRFKGFDGVEPDNVDGYQNDTGFPLTAHDQVVFNRWLAAEAHRRGLSIGLKNDPDQAAQLVTDFDWALTEDCFAEGWCDQMAVFVATGKPVFAAEYTDMDVDLAGLCPQAKRLRFNLLLKARELTAWRATCP
jgi:hypothetical protein